MNSLHYNLAKRGGEQVQCEPPCLSHDIFGLSIMQQAECAKCHASSDPQCYQTFIVYLHVSSILYHRFPVNFNATKRVPA